MNYGNPRNIIDENRSQEIMQDLMDQTNSTHQPRLLEAAISLVMAYENDVSLAMSRLTHDTRGDMVAGAKVILMQALERSGAVEK